jgi:glucose-1-phosphate cytidylyltransferase
MKGYSAYGFRDFVLCLGYKGEMIKDYFLNYDLLNSDFTIHLGSKTIDQIAVAHDEKDWRVTLVDTGQDTMTGGRVARIQRHVADDGLFMLTYGDGVANIDINRLLAFHKEHGRIGTVTGVRPQARFGELQLQGSIVNRFAEKPLTSDAWINGGFFVFDSRIFDYLGGDDCILEREPLERLADDGQLASYLHDGFWQCMDTQRDMEMLNAEWERGAAPWRVWDALTPSADR